MNTFIKLSQNIDNYFSLILAVSHNFKGFQKLIEEKKKDKAEGLLKKQKSVERTSIDGRVVELCVSKGLHHKEPTLFGMCR